MNSPILDQLLLITAATRTCSWLTGLGLEIYWIDWQAQSFELQMPSPDCLTGPSYHHRHHIRKYYHIIISNLVLETDLNICQGLHQSSSSSSSPSPTSRSHLEGVEAGGGEAAEVESCFCCCTQLRFVRIWNFAKISSALQKAHSWSVVDDERYSPIHLRPGSPTARAQCKELAGGLNHI